MNIEIYTREGCTFCDMAKDLIKGRGTPYIEYNIGYHPHHKNELLERVATVRTLPQIFIDNTHIGGYKELRERYNIK
jgi:glutaredoxin 3